MKPRNNRLLIYGVLGWWFFLVPLGCGSDSLPPPKPRVDDATTTTDLSDQPVIRFDDVTDCSGILFRYRNGDDTGQFAIVESLGGGVGVADFDHDHWLDAFIPGGGSLPEVGRIEGFPPGLFRQTDKWQFSNVTSLSRVDSADRYSHGANVGDFDNDGFADVLVTGYGGLRLLQNCGDGTFRDIADRSLLIDPQWSSSAAWGDFNEDGALDLYIAHYVNWSWENHPVCQGSRPGQREVCPPRRFDPVAHKLFLSRNDGTFRDGSEEFGLRKDGKGLGVVVGDVDLDGHVDVYVGNDTVPNFLYRNTGIRFEDAGLLSGTALSDRGTPDGSMGVDIGDLTNDGLPDIWVANYETESFALYRNQGNAFFLHSSQPLGVTAVGALYVGWGTVLFDVDRDSDLDIFCSNGHVIRHPVNAPVRQRPLLYENREGKRFVDVSSRAGDYTNSAHMGRGCASGDLDNDGDLDLLISTVNEPVAVLSNESAPNTHWLSLKLVGSKSCRDAIGTIVRLRRGRDREQVQQVKSGGSYASTNDNRVFFGLGKEARSCQISIRWPSGKEQSIEVKTVDTEIVVIEI